MGMICNTAPQLHPALDPELHRKPRLADVIIPTFSCREPTSNNFRQFFEQSEGRPVFYSRCHNAGEATVQYRVAKFGRLKIWISNEKIPADHFWNESACAKAHEGGYCEVIGFVEREDVAAYLEPYAQLGEDGGLWCDEDGGNWQCECIDLFKKHEGEWLKMKRVCYCDG